MSIYDQWNAPLDVDTGQQTGPFAIARYRVNESGTADFGAILSKQAGSNGESRLDNTYTWGYNVGPYGKINQNEHRFSETIESRYRTSQGINQLEYYMTFQNAEGTVDYRPFSITPRLDADNVEVALRGNSVKIGYSDTSNDWLQLDSTKQDGSLSLYGKSAINYRGSVADFITAGGNPVLGYSGNVGRLFSGSREASLFSNGGRITSDTFTINVGGQNGSPTRGLRWSPVNGWQFQVNDTLWQNMSAPAGFSSTTDSGGYHTGIAGTLAINGGGTSGTNVRLQKTAGQLQNLIDIVDANNSPLFKVDNGGRSFGPAFRTTSDVAALQDYFNPSSPLALGSGAGIGFSNSASWYGNIDTGLKRSAAGVVEINNGTPGALRDLQVRGIRLGQGVTVTNSGTALQVRTADGANFGTLQGKLQTDNAYVAGTPVATGTITIYDGTGTPYKVLVAAGSGAAAASASTSAPSLNEIYGTTASDTLLGTSAADLISGVPRDGANAGAGTVDKLTGNAGNDLFVLGAAGKSFYSSAGNGDYATIADFVTGDRIQLAGGAGNYVLAATEVGGVNGTGIFLDSNGDQAWQSTDELIGVVSGTATNLDLRSTSQFVYS